MWFCILSFKQFEDTFENTQWRKAKQVQPMQLCIHSGRQFEDTFENTQWRKATQMRPMYLCIFWSKQFEETLQNTHGINGNMAIVQLYIPQKCISESAGFQIIIICNDYINIPSQKPSRLLSDQGARPLLKTLLETLLNPPWRHCWPPCWRRPALLCLGAYKIIQGLGVSDIIGHCSIGLLIIWHYSRLFQIWKEILRACLSLTWIIQWGLSTPN